MVGRLVCLSVNGKVRPQVTLRVLAAQEIQDVLPSPQHAFPTKPRGTLPMNEAIAVTNAALGLLLLLILYSRIRDVGSERHLKKHRSKDAGLADLLNYAAMVDDGVIVGKNGSFIAAWLYKGDDNASSTDEQRNMVSFRINQALSGLGNGWMLHVDAVRRPAPNYTEEGFSHFPDPVSAAIDEERRRFFEGLNIMYEGYFVLALTYFPPLLAQSKFVELMFDDEVKGQTKQARTQGLIDSFKRC
jgi:type IV secretion system protein TrbE